MTQTQHPEITEAPHQEIRVAIPTVTPVVMYVILGFTILVYLMQVLSVAIFGYAVYDIDWLEVLGARINSPIREGQIWRLITPAFLHVSLSHIFFNMYALFSIGSFLERQLEHGRFLLLYFLSAFSGNVFSFLLGAEDGLSVGASTAIFGLVAAQAVFFYQNKKLFGDQAKKALSNSAIIIIINVFIGVSLGFDNAGHLGGLLGGAMFAWFAGTVWELAGIPPALYLQDRRESREIITGAGIVLVVFGALTILGMFI